MSGAPPKADVRHNSVHTRGAAVDVALADADKQLLALPSDLDAKDPRASRVRVAEWAAEANERLNYNLLNETLIRAGFIPHPEYWWHYDDSNWQDHPVLRLDAYVSAISGDEQNGTRTTPRHAKVPVEKPDFAEIEQGVSASEDAIRTNRASKAPKRGTRRVTARKRKPQPARKANTRASSNKAAKKSARSTSKTAKQSKQKQTTKKTASQKQAAKKLDARKSATKKTPSNSTAPQKASPRLKKSPKRQKTAKPRKRSR